MTAPKLETNMQTKNSNEELNEVLDIIENQFKPVSIFLYGSRARTDAKEDSDYEIGVLLESGKYVGRTELRKAIGNKKAFSLYPFKFEEFVKYNPDTPFNKNIYVYELLTSAKTLRGQKIIENLAKPEITNLDLLQDAQFNLGRALTATVVARDGHIASATWTFYKSCLFGLRDLIFFETGNLARTYEEILEQGLALVSDEYKPLIQSAYDARQGKEIDTNYFFKNISFLNQFVIPKILEKLK
jgi:predicted nucleotidyltransferase